MKYIGPAFKSLNFIKLLRCKTRYSAPLLTSDENPYCMLLVEREIYRGEPYDYAADIWSMGCVFVELMTLKPAVRFLDLS